MLSNLIPLTIILVSETGMVAIPYGESGAFPDLDSFLTWMVEDKARSGHGPSSFLTGWSGSGPENMEATAILSQCWSVLLVLLQLLKAQRYV